MAWTTAAHGTAYTDTLFTLGVVKPGDTMALDFEKNKIKLRYAMVGILWDSLSSGFQLERIGSDPDFKQRKEYDEV